MVRLTIELDTKELTNIQQMGLVELLVESSGKKKVVVEKTPSQNTKFHTKRRTKKSKHGILRGKELKKAIYITLSKEDKPIGLKDLAKKHGIQRPNLYVVLREMRKLKMIDRTSTKPYLYFSKGGKTNGAQ